MGWFNFEEQLAFYGQYHLHPWNRAIHVVTVPIIFWSFLMCLAKIPIIVLFERFPFNISFAVTFFYILYYLLLEPVAGAIFAPFLLTLTYSSNIVALKNPNSCQIIIACQVVCWAAQILGHFIFEKRAPAFFDSMLQAFLLAPLFGFMELLFLIGYRPALYRRLRERTKGNANAWKLSNEQRKQSKD